MTGLLIKDFYTILKEAKIFLLFAAIMAVIQNDFLFSYAVFFAAMLPITALGYDEKSKWDTLANMLPYTAQEIVGSKYIMGYFDVAAAGLLVCLGRLIGISAGHPTTLEMWASIFLTICCAVIMQAFILPLMFWVGTEKGRLLFILIVVIAVVAATTGLEQLNLNSFQTFVTPSMLLIGVFIITIVISLLSFLISKQIYSRKK